MPGTMKLRSEDARPGARSSEGSPTTVGSQSCEGMVESGAAEATAATGKPFARAYVHAGMVGYDGEKMSKSKGNLVLVSKLREAGRDPMAIRLVLLAHHYRSDWEYTDADLDEAERRLAAWRGLRNETATIPATSLVTDLRAARANDLDAPAALAAVDQWVAAASDIDVDDTEGPRTFQGAIDALLGVRL